ncbi:hypothetical protein QCA50_005552 [Cerrena zonata]|uniref:Cytochrome P450 n=1 Tax=Cerrena zonata TaxID=2478898 RepID=A0AAW0GGS3_9APHY
MLETLSGNPLSTTVVSALISHYIFKRWEQTDILSLAALLLFLPSALSTLFWNNHTATQSLLIAFTVYYIVLATSIVLYRLSPFHPLAKYPGPLPGKISAFHLMWVSFKGRRHLYLQSLHEEYGDIVRIGPNEVSLLDPNCTIHLMGTQGWPKGPNWEGRTMTDDLPMVAIRDTNVHHQRRKPWNRAFNSSSIKEFEPLLRKRVKLLVERLGEQKGTTDLTMWINYFTYDFMGDMAFGGWSEMLIEGDRQGLWQMMESTINTSLVLEHMPWIMPYFRLLIKARIKESPMLGHSEHKMNQRIKDGATSRDLFYYLNNEDGADSQPPPKNLVLSDGLLAIFAGSDTTASVLSNAFYLLIRNHEALQKLLEEIDHLYPAGEDSTDSRHYSEMDYLDAVINETLRLYPAVPSGSQRAAAPGSGGKAIGPYFLPEGTLARIPFYAVQRDPRNFFPHPEAFWPERWIIASSDGPRPDGFIHNTSAFIPFSIGPYNCVGKNLAMHEMRMVLSHTLQNLSINFAKGWDETVWEKELEDTFVFAKGKLPVTVTTRNLNGGA